MKDFDMMPWEKVERVRAKNPDLTIAQACDEAGVSVGWYYNSKRKHKPTQSEPVQKLKRRKAVVQDEVNQEPVLGESAVQPLEYNEALALFDTVQLKATEENIDIDVACHKLGFSWDTYLKSAQMVEARQLEDKRKREEENKGDKEQYFERAVENGVKKALGVAKRIRAVARPVPGQATVIQRSDHDVTAIVLRGNSEAIADLIERLV